MASPASSSWPTPCGSTGRAASWRTANAPRRASPSRRPRWPAAASWCSEMRRLLRHFLGDEGGAAAVEMAAVGSLFIIGAMSAADIGRYAYQTSEVNAAAQAGAQAALVTCDVEQPPAPINCPGLNAAVTTAIQATGLAADVTLDGAITEAYYCLDTNNVLQKA